MSDEQTVARRLLGREIKILERIIQDNECKDEKGGYCYVCDVKVVLSMLRDLAEQQLASPPTLEYTVELNEETAQHVLRINDKWIQHSIYKGDLHQLAHAIAASLGRVAAFPKEVGDGEST